MTSLVLLLNLPSPPPFALPCLFLLLSCHAFPCRALPCLPISLLNSQCSVCLSYSLTHSHTYLLTHSRCSLCPTRYIFIPSSLAIIILVGLSAFLSVLYFVLSAALVSLDLIRLPGLTCPSLTCLLDALLSVFWDLFALVQLESC